MRCISEFNGVMTSLEYYISFVIEIHTSIVFPRGRRAYRGVLCTEFGIQYQHSEVRKGILE